MLTLEILHSNRQLLIVYIGLFRIRSTARQGIQAAAKPANLIPLHSQRQRSGAGSLRFPDDRKFPEPIPRKIIDGDFLVMLAEVQRRGLVVQTRQYDAMPLTALIGQRQDGGPVQRSDLSPGTALLQTREARFGGLTARIPVVRQRGSPQ